MRFNNAEDKTLNLERLTDWYMGQGRSMIKNEYKEKFGNSKEKDFYMGIYNMV